MRLPCDYLKIGSEASNSGHRPAHVRELIVALARQEGQHEEVAKDAKIFIEGKSGKEMKKGVNRVKRQETQGGVGLESG